MHDLYSKRAFSSSREAPPQYLGTLRTEHILTSQLETGTQTKTKIMSMRAHALENVASWLGQDQLLEHNMPSTKHISFLDPLLLQSDNKHSTAQDNTTQDFHKQDTQAYSCRLRILINASLELHFTKENARTSRAAGRNARTMARRCIRLACSIYIYERRSETRNAKLTKPPYGENLNTQTP